MLKMGIVGLGKMGAFHADWIRQNEGMELVAVCDKNSERLETAKTRYGVEVYDDYNKFLGIENMDFVVVVTTNDVHESLSIKALENKKNVIVEKPMSVNYESCFRMVKAAEQHKKHLFVHQSSRWDRDFLLIKDTIASGILGEILTIQSNVLLCDEGWPAWGIDGMANPWRIKAEYFGGLLFDWGPHLVDQMLLLKKEDPVGVYGLLQSGVWTTEVDDHFFAVVKFKDKTICRIEVSNNARIALPRWHVIGTKGTLEVKGFHEPVWDQAELVFVGEDGRKESRKITLHDVKESGIEGGFYEDLIPFLKGKKKEFVSMHEAAKVVKVLELIKKSSDENRFIAF